MKIPFVKSACILLLSLGFVLSSCVKDEEGYSEFIQHYLDSLTILDTISVDLDVPCNVGDNIIEYYTYDHDFTQFDVDDLGDNGYRIEAYNSDDDIFLYLTFENRPLPGKYVTDFFYGNPPDNDSEVLMEYETPSDDFLALDGDTIYVEKITGGAFVFSFCDVQIDAGWGGYYASGSFEIDLTEFE